MLTLLLFSNYLSGRSVRSICLLFRLHLGSHSGVKYADYDFSEEMQMAPASGVYA